ncbi:hypothetical protein DC498_13100 [Terrimonas sp.]|uniref:hypothetical protein n=1 Tax=Terrimonas sp. TaxID=1914338 RepID=UPI000D511658|nr:hypothetical protein [Terrimonas sp.]PVD51659.1 hypothetical protein DC498_13100 [Terrimonas sp.]
MTAVDKYTLIMLSVIALIYGCSKEKEPGNTTNPTGNCRVKEENTSGEILQPYRTAYEFNNAGFLTKESYFNNGDLTWYEGYEYDQNGKITSWSQFSPGGHIREKRIASYGTDGRISGYTNIRWDAWSIDTSYYYYAYEGDKFIGYTLRGADTTSKIIRYYQGGNLVKMESFNGNNEIEEYQIYTYSDVLNKEFEQESNLVLLSRALPSKYLPSTRKIFNVVLDKIEYDESFGYITNSEGYVVEMTNKTTRYLDTPYSNLEVISTTKYTYQCD